MCSFVFSTTQGTNQLVVPKGRTIMGWKLSISQQSILARTTCWPPASSDRMPLVTRPNQKLVRHRADLKLHRKSCPVVTLGPGRPLQPGWCSKLTPRFLSQICFLNFTLPELITTTIIKVHEAAHVPAMTHCVPVSPNTLHTISNDLRDPLEPG